MSGVSEHHPASGAEHIPVEHLVSAPLYAADS